MNRIDPPAVRPEIFELTMKGLEMGLKVGDIAAYGFFSCRADEDAAEVMQRTELKAYDCIPVTDGERVVGVLERSRQMKPGHARDQMRHLDEGFWSLPMSH